MEPDDLYFLSSPRNADTDCLGPIRTISGAEGDVSLPEASGAALRMDRYLLRGVTYVAFQQRAINLNSKWQNRGQWF